MVTKLAMSMLSDASWVQVERVLNGMTAEQTGNWINEVRYDPAYIYPANFKKSLLNSFQTGISLPIKMSKIS